MIPWTAAHQASLSLPISRSLPKFMSIESVMPSNHLILCLPLLLLPSIFPSIRALAKILIWLILHFLQTLMISHCLWHEVWKSLAWNTRVFTNWPCQISPAQIHFLLPFYFSSSYILHSGCPKSWNLPEDTRLFEISEIQYMFFLLEMTFCLILTKSQYTHFWPFPHKPTWKTNFIKE